VVLADAAVAIEAIRIVAATIVSVLFIPTLLEETGAGAGISGGP
jgi:hypothetical protein